MSGRSVAVVGVAFGLSAGLWACGGTELVPAPDIVPEDDCTGRCVKLVAGNGFGFADGALEEAQFEMPRDLAAAPSGEIYIADMYSNAIRVIDGDQVRTLTGGGGGGYRDGFLNEARFRLPAGLAVDKEGAIYVADTGNHRIRKIAFGIVATIGGNGQPGHRDGHVSEALFNQPVDVAVDDRGNVYVAEGENRAIRKITPEGWVMTLAGGPDMETIDRPRYLAVGPSETIYFTDGDRHLIRKIEGRKLGTLTGLIVPGFAEGDLSVARLREPTGIAVDDRERVYVSDAGNRRVRMIEGGMVKVLAGNGFIGQTDGNASQATFTQLLGVTVSNEGAVYVSDGAFASVRRIEVD